MDQDLYELMREVYEAKKSDFSKDIKFVGAISSDEMTSTR